MKISGKRGYTLIDISVGLLITLTLIAVIGVILFPLYTKQRNNQQRYNCLSNLKRLGLAMAQYAQDNDQRMPLMASNAVTSSTYPFSRPYGWADSIQPYVKSLGILQCPTESGQQIVNDATQVGFTDYWFNSNLNALPLKNISSSATILLGDGNDGSDGTDARYNRNVIPKRWLDDENSPSRRHSNYGNYVFTDGHVKFLPSNRVSVQDDVAVMKP